MNPDACMGQILSIWFKKKKKTHQHSGLVKASNHNPPTLNSPSKKPAEGADLLYNNLKRKIHFHPKKGLKKLNYLEI